MLWPRLVLPAVILIARACWRRQLRLGPPVRSRISARSLGLPEGYAPHGRGPQFQGPRRCIARAGPPARPRRWNKSSNLHQEPRQQFRRRSSQSPVFSRRLTQIEGGKQSSRVLVEVLLRGSVRSGEDLVPRNYSTSSLGNCMNSRKPFVVPALAGIIPCRLKAVQQTAQSIDAISYHATGAIFS